MRTQDVGASLWHEQMGASRWGSQEIQRRFPPPPQPSRVTSKQVFGKPLGTGGSCRLQHSIVGVSMGVRCLI